MLNFGIRDLFYVKFQKHKKVSCYLYHLPKNFTIMKHNLIQKRFAKSAIALFVYTFLHSSSSYGQTCPPPQPY